MFQETDTTTEDKMSSIQKTHKFIKPLDHEIFGRIYIYQHYATQNLVIMKEKIANNPDHARQEEALIEKRSLMRHPNLMVVKDWSVKATTKICAEFYTIRAFYSYYLDNAELLSQRRLKQNQPLDDIELMQLVYDGIDVLSYLQTQGYHHGFIRPEMLARDDKGVFILSDKLLEGSAVDAHTYARTMGLDPYCSPLIWDFLVNGPSKQKKTNVYKDDAFSFGLVLLRVATLESPRAIFEPQGHINQSTLSALIDRASKRYEHLLLFRQIIERLLMIPEEQRMDALTLKASMPVREQLQLFFSADNEDVFFDGPKSQHYNTVLGKESVLPYAIKQNYNKSMYMDNSNILNSNSNSPARGNLHAKQSDDIFANKKLSYSPHHKIVMDGALASDELHETDFVRSNLNSNAPRAEARDEFRGMHPLNQTNMSSPGYRDSTAFTPPPQGFGRTSQDLPQPQGSPFVGNPYQNTPRRVEQVQQSPDSNFMRSEQSLEYDIPRPYENGSSRGPSAPVYQNQVQPPLYRPEVQPPSPQPMVQPPGAMYQAPLQQSRPPVYGQASGFGGVMPQPPTVVRSPPVYPGSFTSYSPQPGNAQFLAQSHPFHTPAGVSGQPAYLPQPQLPSPGQPRTGNNFAPLH